ncbi:potassium-transporting ATPase subunit KdpA [Clostridium botulinum]|uniref:Potassium-transporting ATPase potassium-binding subunit n=1 Tax=Clostridium botulinum (strain Eklund 17B / Type B) TaxID=935198 RepID=KDPA_CLOBB|nr:RecName: Full=Potassium-transporting ATPase potassium-binding subunit; AltName: Full=ATP phosphohydrolase [potassium-transporting] A chain; AltName: Full=Potassium-binding and translocating subunit A; AltName: Full=Potassium-translocating ATPase A chain [Clostridium botulinum B str. Eklund 17B (NRP)]MBY6975189.1 potassium-transporting ATPase subunit KdpA [Clostridium botulinum]ACD23630.1 K+-transporting ATPase, A subunit [Clostridium botulinum B str. Eklund 17B (NRP)]MBY7000170.1 potassium-tr
MMNLVLQYGLYILILVVLAIPLGNYIGKIMNGEKVFLSKILTPCENFIYKILHIDKDEDMSWKKYSFSVLAFSIISLIVLFLLHIFQGFLPLNPEKVSGTSWDLAFNNAISFVTNTNWQGYSGESSLSYFTQMMGLTVQNFVSAAVGISVLFALIRGFIRVKQKGIGNFWIDITRTVLYILIPLSIVVSLALVSQGVVQNFKQYETVSLLEPITLEDGTLVTEEVVPLGPAASQIAIKQLGTNGGGFMGTNSAHPIENPTILSNLFEMISLLLIPVALCFTFGRNIKDRRQGIAIFVAMGIMLVVAMAIVGVNEQIGTPQMALNGQVDLSTINQAGGNMEGKEARFGIATSSTWATFTTAASNGSVNSMHDSYTPIGGMIPMLLMQLGEVVFGGVGCGLYGMIGFAILAVFMAGLMVGRTPEYLGKKIEPFEMKMAVLVCLATPIAILIGSGIASILPETVNSLNNSGAHGFSEVLYAYTSAGGNNGSAFAGFAANTPFINISIGLSMIFARFVPMMGTLAIAGSMVKKKKVAESVGTLPTHNAMFIGLLIFVVLLIGALSFFPALALGPIAEFFQMLG